MNTKEIIDYVGKDYRVFAPLMPPNDDHGYEIRKRHKEARQPGEVRKSIAVPTQPTAAHLDAAIRELE